MRVYEKCVHFWDPEAGRYVIDESESVFVDNYKGEVIQFGKDSAPAPTPDPQIGQAARDNVALGKDWLNFAQEQFDVGNQRQENMDALTKRVTDSQLATQDNATKRGDEQWSQYNDTFRPIEQQIANEATNYDSAARQEQVAAEAKADVASNAAMAADAQRRTMASMGINPTSGRYQAVDRGTALTTGLAEAGAQNTARTNVRQMGAMLRKDAASLGRGMTGTAAQTYGVGLNAGNSAVGNQTAANSNFYQNNQTMTNGFGGAIGANNSAAGILNTQYGTDVGAYKAKTEAAAASGASMAQGIGSLASTGAMLFL